MHVEPDLERLTSRASEQPERLLIIEDNRADSRRLERLLDQVMPRHPREVVTTLKEAAASISASEPLMIVSDLNLPDSEGLETVDQLLTQSPTVPVVVMTTQGFDSVGLAAVEAGAEDFLTKGTFDALDLARVLLMAIERHRTHVDTIRQAHRDSLTGLSNRSYFERALKASLARASRLGDECAVAFIDVDKFKSINDDFGHLVGDEILCQMADRIRSSIRPYDTGARFGGDEFAILLTSIDNSRALAAIVSRLRNALDQPYQLSGGAITVELTSSIGIAMSGTGNSTMSNDEIVHNADRAMYVAKKHRSGFIFYDSEFHQESGETYEFEQKLADAINGSALHVFYQPIVRVDSGELVGLEALARFDHPDRGLLDAHEFMDVAAETRFAVRIDRRVLELAVEQFGDWIRDNPQLASTRLEINTSPQNWADPHWLSFVRETADTFGIKLEQLCFSVSEPAIGSFDEDMAASLARARAEGALISIDHFGTGDISLRRLSTLPFDVVKIDQNLVRGDQAAISRMIEMLSVVFEVAVVGTGVETETDSVITASIAEFGEGFRYGRPAPPEEIAANLAKWNGYSTIPHSKAS